MQQENAEPQKGDRVKDTQVNAIIPSRIRVFFSSAPLRTPVQDGLFKPFLWATA